MSPRVSVDNNTVTVADATGANGGGGAFTNLGAGTLNITGSIIHMNTVTGNSAPLGALKGAGVFNATNGNVYVANSSLFVISWSDGAVALLTFQEISE